MTALRLFSALACLAVCAHAVAAPPAHAASQARTGGYKVVKRGPHVTRARCLEGGYVLVPTHEKATTAERDRDIHEACKTVDYTQ